LPVIYCGAVSGNTMSEEDLAKLRIWAKMPLFSPRSRHLDKSARDTQSDQAAKSASSQLGGGAVRRLCHKGSVDSEQEVRGQVSSRHHNLHVIYIHTCACWQAPVYRASHVHR
jgi:hypothetical protein